MAHSPIVLTLHIAPNNSATEPNSPLKAMRIDLEKEHHQICSARLSCNSEG